LVNKGGEPVLGVAKKSFSRDVHRGWGGLSGAAYLGENQGRYIFPMPGRSVEELLEGRKTAGTIQEWKGSYGRESLGLINLAYSDGEEKG